MNHSKSQNEQSEDSSSLKQSPPPHNDHPVAKEDLEDSYHDALDEDESQDNENEQDFDEEHEDGYDSDVSATLAHLTLLNESGIEVMKLEDIAELIKNKSCENILVLSGAGVSVSAGIPVRLPCIPFIKYT